MRQINSHVSSHNCSYHFVFELSISFCLKHVRCLLQEESSEEESSEEESSEEESVSYIALCCIRGDTTCVHYTLWSVDSVVGMKRVKMILCAVKCEVTKGSMAVETVMLLI